MAAMKKIGWVTMVALLGLLTLPVLSQVDNGGGGPPGGGGGGGRRDPAAFRQRMLQRLQEQLGATDDEFAVLQPKIEAVFQLQRDAGGFGRGFMGGGRNRNRDNAGPPSTQPESPMQTAISDLRDTLDNTASTPDQIKVKLEALRQARTKARADLAKAQQDLRDLLTTRQEAQLVLTGMLD